MKHTGVIFTAVVLIFWGSMNTMVVLRQREMASLDQYRSGVTTFLGDALLRERWMSIYKKNRKIGYSGYTFEKVYALEGVEIHSQLESKFELEVAGRSCWVELQGALVTDEEMKPLQLRLDASFAGEGVTLTGERKDGQFLLSVKRGEAQLLAIPMPLTELHLGNGLAPVLPIAGFKVGDSFQVPCFNPVTLGRATASVKVKSRQTREMGGLPVDAFLLETEVHGMTSRSWVTAAGELLQQELGRPLEDVVLRADTMANARRIVRR